QSTDNGFARLSEIYNMSEMFGLVVAGRLVQTDFCIVSEREAVVEITDADSINHIVLFLTGVCPFPDGMSGAVYIRWPEGNGSSNWHFLGQISNDKPSVIFKVAQLKKASGSSENMFNNHMEEICHGSAQVGILVEKNEALEGKTAAEGTAASQQSTLMEMGYKIARWVVHHAESFSVSVPNGEGRTVEMVKLATIHEWYNMFARRFQQNPNFWRSLNYS
ncbi:hypothetical protein PMAYCL1PPCAC_18159, partial [Pristionchus mayeri]